MGEIVNPTNLSLADLMRGSPDPKKSSEILTKWYSKMIGCDPSDVKTIILDDNRTFPIFHKDTLEDLIERFSKMYPIEAKATIEIIGECKKDNPDGKSDSGLMQSLMSIPVILKCAIVSQYGESWFSKKVNIRKLARLMPKFCTCDSGRV